jgi:quercetin dioxygenase-like cupin family protein
MKAYHYTDVLAQSVEGLPGVAMRWVIAQNVSAPHFAMRVVEVQPGAATEHHNHAWEHEVFVLEGQGSVCDAQGETAIASGSCIYVAPDEMHQFRNTGTALLRFICVIPIPRKD